MSSPMYKVPSEHSTCIASVEQTKRPLQVLVRTLFRPCPSHGHSEDCYPPKGKNFLLFLITNDVDKTQMVKEQSFRHCELFIGEKSP